MLGAKWGRISSATNQEVDISATNFVATGKSIRELSSKLDELLSALETGRWDDLSSMESELLTALDAVRTSPINAQNSLEILVALQEKMERAISSCQARKEQIAPLLAGLRVSTPKSK